MKRGPVPVPLLLQVMDNLPFEQLAVVKKALHTKLGLNLRDTKTSSTLLSSLMKRSSEHDNLLKINDSSLPLPNVVLNPLETVDEIKDQIQHYTNFVVNSIERDLGRCKPAYIAINTTISLFCDKVTAPVMSFWWILQFFPPTLIIIIVTAMLIDKLD